MAAVRNLHIKYILVIIAITAIAVLSVVALFDRTDRMFKAENALASTQSQLSSALTELSTTTIELATTESELSQTQADLTVTRDELTKTQDTLQTTADNLAAKSEKLTTTEVDLAAASEQLAVESELATTLQSSLNNLQANYDALTTGYSYVVKDPTYKEMKSFLSADIIDSFTYTTDEYVCHDFAAQVSSNAREKKIRCGYVLIDFLDADVVGHALIAFYTTDRGLIYVEPQTDEEVRLAVGKHYWSTVISKTGVGYLAPKYDDTVEDIFILW